MPEKEIKAGAIDIVSDPVAEAEAKHKGKGDSIIATYMWRAILGIAAAWFVAVAWPSIDAVLVQGVDTLKTNADANKTITDTQSLNQDLLATGEATWQVSQDESRLRAQFIAPAPYLHLLDLGWTVKEGSTYTRIEAYHVANDLTTREYSDWYKMPDPMIDENGFIVMTWDVSDAPRGMLISGRKYYTHIKLTLNTPTRAFIRYFKFILNPYERL